MSPDTYGPEIVLPGQFQPKAQVEIAPDYFIKTETPQPNWWWRFWQWLLLGWKWEAL